MGQNIIRKGRNIIRDREVTPRKICGGDGGAVESEPWNKINDRHCPV